MSLVLGCLQHLGCHRITIDLAGQVGDYDVETVAFHWNAGPPEDGQMLQDIRAYLERLCLDYAKNLPNVTRCHFEHHDDTWYGLVFFHGEYYRVFYLQQADAGPSEYEGNRIPPRLRASLERILLRAQLTQQSHRKDSRLLGL